MVALTDKKSEELRQHWIDIEKYIHDELGFEIKKCSCGVNNNGCYVRFEIKEHRFEIDEKTITESTFDSRYAHHLVTRRLENGLDNDEYFNLSLQQEVSEVLKEENISKIRKYNKDAYRNYVLYLIELEGNIRFKSKTTGEEN